MNVEHRIADGVPIGFLFSLSRRGNRDRFCLRALNIGILLSSGIAFSQLFIQGRYASGIDVLANSLGAWLGAAAFEMLREGLGDDCPIRLFSLELPLMNRVNLSDDAGDNCRGGGIIHLRDGNCRNCLGYSVVL